MTALWTADAVAAATGGATAGNWATSGVSIDTRTLAPGDLFVALTGPNRDGHDFVAEALDRGAAAAVVSRVPDGLGYRSHLVLVADTQAALEGLGRAGRRRSAARVAGVTGSAGKTGTKDALRHALGRQAPTHASAASHNNHWGVPLTLARLPEAASFAVLEMGMNHAGEIRALTRMARPHVAVVTTVAPAHLEFFPSVEAIADAKGEIFEGLEPVGVAVLNRDNEHHTRLVAHAERCRAGRIVTFGRHPSADWRLDELRLGPETSEVAVVAHARRRYAYRLGVPGEHVALNSLAVLAVADALGADVPLAARSLGELRASPGRGGRKRIPVAGGEALLLDESYNANPASMRAALAVLGRAPGRRRIAVLGDMRELGPTSGELHAALAGAVADAAVDLVFTCGPLMSRLHEALTADRRGAHAADSEALAPLVAGAMRAGDTVLVKGSLGSRMVRVVAALAGAPATAEAVG